MSQSSNLLNYYDSKSYFVQQLLEEFIKPIHQNKIFENKSFLISNSDLVKFDNETWHLRPEVFCYDYYKESEIWPVILIVNEVTSRFNFRSDRLQNEIIIAPRLSAIQKVLSS